jgi:hypothetical protein
LFSPIRHCRCFHWPFSVFTHPPSCPAFPRLDFANPASRGSRRFGVGSEEAPRRAGLRPPLKPFGYDAPYPSASGTSTHPIWALPSTHYNLC